MPIDPKDREYVISSVVDILRHRKRERLVSILEERLSSGDYDDDKERDLDQVVLALAKVVNEQLDPRDR